KIAGEYYHVIGVVRERSVVIEGEGNGNGFGASSNGGGVSGSVYIPVTTMKSRFGETQVQFGGATGMMGEKVELSEITIKVSDMDKVLPTRDVLAAMLEKFHKKKDYQIIVPLELLRQAARTKRIFSIVLGSIAAISLLVGGIGIMNIMLATVSERTREIGIRRALGARKHDIVIQFLSETVMLTLIGGLLGMALGAIIPILVTMFGHMPTVITSSSMILSFGISAGVGLTFGLYPAYQAANMDPIESLRHE
ncbi:MAG: ABC transporter permease, partial [Planctomycetota bacterium]